MSNAMNKNKLGIFTFNLAAKTSHTHIMNEAPFVAIPMNFFLSNLLDFINATKVEYTTTNVPSATPSNFKK
jgi:hypothetical protein